MGDGRTEQWEARLREALERVDAELERRHGRRYRRHPARDPHGAAARRQYDGLFGLSAGFTAGFGSRHGAGYAVDLRLATLDAVPATERQALMRETAELLGAALVEVFPGRDLRVVQDAQGMKIVGNLQLDG